MHLLRWLVAALVAFVVAAVGIFWLDAPIARWVAEVGGARSEALRGGTRVLEVAFGATLSKFFIGAVCISLGVVLWRWRREAGRALVFTGAMHLVARIGGGMLKNVFMRARPFEALARGNLDVTFFQTQGSAFPSGHVLHFTALYFAAFVLLPRWRWPLLPVPVFIFIARVGTNDHWFSDAAASVGMAALIAGVLGAALGVIPWRLPGSIPHPRPEQVAS